VRGHIIGVDGPRIPYTTACVVGGVRVDNFGPSPWARQPNSIAASNDGCKIADKDQNLITMASLEGEYTRLDILRVDPGKATGLVITGVQSRLRDIKMIEIPQQILDSPVFFVLE
jgi:hypothetical protein